jgi:hypothetical protein
MFGYLVGSDHLQCQFVSVDCGAAPDGQVQRAYRVRIGLFLVCVVLVVLFLSVVYQEFRRWLA